MKDRSDAVRQPARSFEALFPSEFSPAIWRWLNVLSNVSPPQSGRIDSDLIRYGTAIEPRCERSDV
jgi:hypothetical protein